MAHVVIGGAQEIGAIAFGQPHPGTLQFLQAQLQVPSQILTDAGKQFFSDVGQIYERFNSEEALRSARAAIRKVEAIFQPEAIRPLWELADLQNASYTMQRWIMAEPTLRKAYHEQRVDGYAETYMDNAPGQLGRDHYDFRHLHSGVVQDVADNSHYDWKVTHYLDELPEGERKLTLEEKVDVFTTWDAVRLHLARGKDDPSSPFGGKL